MKRRRSVELIAVGLGSAVAGILVGWFLTSASRGSGQTFGSSAVDTIRDFAPLIQGFTTFLGAALGGVVAMVTTRLVLSGTEGREREKLRADAAIKRGEILRSKAEEALSKIYDTLDECNEFAQITGDAAHAKLNGGGGAAVYQRSARHKAILEAQVLLDFYFPQHEELVRNVMAAYQEFYKWQNIQFGEAVSNPGPWLSSLRTVFVPKLGEHHAATSNAIHALATALKDDVYLSLP